MTFPAPPNTDQTNLQSRILQWLTDGEYISAERACDMAIRKDKIFPKIWFYLGVAYQGQGKNTESISALSLAVEKWPFHVDAWSALATALSALGRYQEACSATSQALELSPDSAQCMANMGMAWQQLEDFESALKFYRLSLERNPEEPTAIINLSTCLIRTGSVEEAKNHCLLAIERLPSLIQLHNNLAESYIQLLHLDLALLACDKGLQIDERCASLHFKRALVLAYLGRFDESQAALTWAQVLYPDILLEYYPMWAVENGLSEESTELYLDAKLVFFDAAYFQQVRCDWRLRDNFVQLIKRFILNAPPHLRTETLPSMGFQMCSLPISGMERLALASNIAEYFEQKAWVFGKQPYHDRKLAKIRKPENKLKIGYLSPDFRMHAMATLTMPLYTLHDRERFEVHAYSLLKAGDHDYYRKRIEKSCDHFNDVDHLDSDQIAQKINDDGIDILVDLGGYTSHTRTDVLALRPAPIQIAYLGYPSTMGADFISYAIENQYSCPPGFEEFWHESPICLPNSHFIYDTEINNDCTLQTRSDFGLPPDAVVFCCFNANNKIDPVLFESWMKILHAVPDSVLWFISTHSDHPPRLLAEAEKRNIPPHRLIFCSSMLHADHVKRYQLADLFLDTYWHNGHTTGMEALWQGLPILTCMGPVTSSRWAASFLNALQMPELITSTREEYEALAIDLANTDGALEDLKRKLKEKRTTAALFDMKRTVGNIERAYNMIWERYINKLPPIPLWIEEECSESV